MTTNHLPQHHCYNQADHPAHNVPSSVYPHAARERCPGRVTCRTITSEKYGEPAHPMDLDPFAGTDSIWD